MFHHLFRRRLAYAILGVVTVVSGVVVTILQADLQWRIENLFSSPDCSLDYKIRAQTGLFDGEQIHGFRVDLQSVGRTPPKWIEFTDKKQSIQEIWQVDTRNKDVPTRKHVRDACGWGPLKDLCPYLSEKKWENRMVRCKGRQQLYEEATFCIPAAPIEAQEWPQNGIVSYFLVPTLIDEEKRAATDFNVQLPNVSNGYGLALPIECSIRNVRYFWVRTLSTFFLLFTALVIFVFVGNLVAVAVDKTKK